MFIYIISVAGPKSSSLSGGGIAGISVGVIVVIAIVILLVFFFGRRSAGTFDPNTESSGFDNAIYETAGNEVILTK